MFDNSLLEQINLQKEHIQHLEGLIFKEKQSQETLKSELNKQNSDYQDLKNKFDELESFALKIHKNIFFKVYTFFKRNL